MELCPTAIRAGHQEKLIRLSLYIMEGDLQKWNENEFSRCSGFRNEEPESIIFFITNDCI